jgi:tetratricopeptide (TPR) repeat protein
VLALAPRRTALVPGTLPGTLLGLLLGLLPGPGCGGAADAPAARADRADRADLDHTAGTPGAAADEARFEGLRARAVALHERGDDRTAALGALEAALALRPDHPGLNVRLGRLCMDLRLNERALAALERAHAARPDDSGTLLTIVSLQVGLGRYEEALRRVTDVLHDPELRGEALYQQALALERLGRTEAALRAAHETDALPPGRGYRAQALLGRLALEAGDFETARSRFLRALDGRPDLREALKGLADSTRRLGREDEATRWDEVLALFVQLNDSVFADAADRQAERRALLETLLDAYPAWGAGFEQLAELQRAQGDRSAACATLERWLAHHGDGLAPDAEAALRRRYCEDGP